MESFLRNAVGSAYEMGAGQSAQGDGGGGAEHGFQGFMPRGLFRFGGRAGDSPQPQQPQQQPQQQQPPETVRPPPASARAIRQLPAVTVLPEDLVDENNRECCICFEAHNLKDRATRLPCSHIYHPQCIVDWLKRSCTCPVCRYELPTDDPQYEASRRQRMANRKPRYARYELDRMSVREIRALADRVRLPLPGRGVGMERGELIQLIVDSGRIELIAAPEPVEHQLSVLRSMGVGRLRRTMEEAGVFFSPEDVVEKEDMVQIFVRSGRLVLLPEHKDDNAGDDFGDDDDDDGVEPMDIDEDSTENKCINGGDDADHHGAKAEEDAASTNWSDASSSQADKDDAVQSQFDESPVQMFGSQQGNGAAPPEASVHANEPERTQDGSLPTVEEDTSPPPPPAAEVPSWVYREQPTPASNMDGSEQSLPNLTRQTRMAAYSSRSVSQLRSIASERGIDVSDCVEKRDMIGRIADAEGYYQAA